MTTNNSSQPDNQEILADELTEVHKVPVSSQLTVLAVLLLALFGSGFMPKVLAFFSTEDNPPSELYEDEPDYIANIDTIEETKVSFVEISLLAQSAFVWDVANQKVLYEKNPDSKLALASITKLMTALVAHEIAEDDSSVRISKDAILQDGESGFLDGESFTLERLTDLTLMSSSNDGAFAMAAAAGALLGTNNPTETFVEAMNIRAEEIGLTQTYFRNPTGLDISLSEAGAYSSARDVAFLMEYILKNQPDILARTTDNYAAIYNRSGGYHEAENTNPTVNKIPGIIGSKTGYTDLAGGNLTVAFDAGLNHPIVIVVLDSTLNGRFQDVIKLVTATRNSLQ